MLELTIKAKDFIEMKSQVLELYEKWVGDTSHKIERQLKFEDHRPLNPIPVIGPGRVDLEIEEMQKPFTPEVKAQLQSLVQQPASSEPQEVDSRGIPWDARVHSTSKGLNKDGSWRTRRGVDEKLLAAVESALTPTPVPTVVNETYTPVPPVPPTNVIVSPPIFSQPPPISVAVSPQTALPAMPQYDEYAGARKQAHDFESFKATLIQSLAKLVKDGRLTIEYINSLKTYFKVDEIWKLNDEQLTEMFNQFATAGLITNVSANT